MSRTHFCLAGLQFSLESENGLCMELPPEYEPFTRSGQRAAFAGARYHVTSPDIPATRPAGSAVLWQNDLWRMGRRPDDRLFFEIFDVQTGAWHYVGDVTNDFSEGALHPRRRPARPHSVLPLHHPHDRALILGRLAHLRGGVIHSSCVVADGKALLFVGRSGAGKTTMARLWRQAGATIVNDERNIVRQDGPVALAGSSPWHGEENQVSPITAPLAGVFYLSKSPENRLKEIPCEESVPRLFTSTFVPVYFPEGPALVLDAWAAILDQVPSYELGFAPDERVVKFCLSALA